MSVVAQPTPSDAGYVSSIISKGVDSYYWSKERALESKVLAVPLKPSLRLVETSLAKAKELSPVSVDKVVTVLDTKVDSAIKYSQDTIKVVSARPTKLKNDTLGVLHKNLEKLKIEEPETKEDEEEPSFVGIVTDVKDITSQSANKILEVSEQMVDKYLPQSDEPDTTEVIPKEPTGPAYRAYNLSKAVTKRMQKRAVSQFDSLRMRTGKVVHVDLVKYSEMLDLDGKKAWLSDKKDTVKGGIDSTVVQPLVRARSTVGHKFGDLKEVAKKYKDAARERVVHIKVPFSDHVIRIWTVVGDECDQRLVQPCEQIIATFKQELHKQQEIVKNKEDDPNKPLTIEAGLRAVVAAARFRLKKEWELRVAPGLDIVLSKTPFAKKEASTPKSDDMSYKVGGEFEESDGSTEPIFDKEDE